MIPTEEEFKAMQIADRMRRKRFWRWVWIVLILSITGIVGAVLYAVSPDFRMMLSDGRVQGAIVIIPIVIWLFMRGKDDDKPLQDQDDDEVSPWMSTLIRWTTWAVFHFALYMIGQQLLSYFFYQPFGTTGWVVDLVITPITFLLKGAGFIFLVWSALWSSLDGDAIGLNQQGVILWFEKYICSASSGFICRGLPKWCGSKVEIVDLETQNVVVGLIKKGEREPFIVECPQFRVVVDIAAEFAPIGRLSKRILKLGGNIKPERKKEIEKRLVQKLNEAVYRVCNGGKVGGQVFNFTDINDLRKATKEISDAIMADENLRNELEKFGYMLKSVTLKDFENQDQTVIAQIQKEKAEGLSWENTLKKAQDMLNKAKLANPDDPISFQECMNRVQADEKTLQRIIIDGGSQQGVGNNPVTPVVVMPPASK